MALEASLVLSCMLGSGFLTQWLAWRAKLPSRLKLLRPERLGATVSDSP